MFGIINTVGMPLLASRSWGQELHGVRAILATHEIIEDPYAVQYILKPDTKEFGLKPYFYGNVQTPNYVEVGQQAAKSGVPIVTNVRCADWRIKHIVIAMDANNNFIVATLDPKGSNDKLRKIKVSELNELEKEGTVAFYPPWTKRVVKYRNITIQRYSLLRKSIQAEALSKAEVVLKDIAAVYNRHVAKIGTPPENGNPEVIGALMQKVRVMEQDVLNGLQKLSMTLKSILGEYLDNYDFYFFWKNMFALMQKYEVPFAITDRLTCITNPEQEDGRIIVSTVGANTPAVWAKLTINPYAYRYFCQVSYSYLPDNSERKPYVFYAVQKLDSKIKNVDRRMKYWVVPTPALELEARKFSFERGFLPLVLLSSKKLNWGSVNWVVSKEQANPQVSIDCCQWLEKLVLPHFDKSNPPVYIEIASLPKLKEIEGLGEYKIKYLHIGLGLTLEKIDLSGYLSEDNAKTAQTLLAMPSLREIILPESDAVRNCILRNVTKKSGWKQGTRQDRGKTKYVLTR